MLVLRAILELSPRLAQPDAMTLASIIGSEAHRAKLDPLLVVAVAFVESSFDQKKRSRKNAVGLMGVLEANHPGVDLTDPRVNVNVGCRELQRRFWRVGVSRGLEGYAGKGPRAKAYAARVIRIWAELQERPGRRAA